MYIVLNFTHVYLLEHGSDFDTAVTYIYLYSERKKAESFWVYQKYFEEKLFVPGTNMFVQSTIFITESQPKTELVEAKKRVSLM